MASLNVSTLLGSGIYRIQRGSTTGVANVAALSIPISAVNLAKAELFLLACRVSTVRANNAGGYETVLMADATLQLTANSIYVAFGDRRDQTGSYRITWEIKEWN